MVCRILRGETNPMAYDREEFSNFKVPNKQNENSIFKVWDLM